MKDGINSIGEYIKSIRKQNKVTIAKLSEDSGVSPTFISQVENSQRNPSPEVLRKLADALEGVDYIHLMQLAGYIDDKEKLQQEIIKLKETINAYNNMIQAKQIEMQKANEDNDADKINEIEKTLDLWQDRKTKFNTELNIKMFKLASDETSIRELDNEQNASITNSPIIITLDSNNEGDFLFANEDGVLSNEIQKKIKSMIKILLD